jgi:hypothetical protein
MNENSRQMRQTTTEEVRLEAGRPTHFSAAVRSIGHFDHLSGARNAIWTMARIRTKSSHIARHG